INVYIRRKVMLNALTRSHKIEHMAKTEYDLLIIGGGITGAGIALDATLSRLILASKAIPAPVIPPPIISNSYSVFAICSIFSLEVTKSSIWRKQNMIYLL